MLLKRRGVEEVQVYAFAPLGCMEQELALSCCKYVQSVAFRDDVVVRSSPQALADLHEELLAYDWEAAWQVCLYCNPSMHQPRPS